jgi:para-aminobenzoate synthetase/4-amino-4-deoxychorismate lyase
MTAAPGAENGDLWLLDDGLSSDGGAWLLQRPETAIACDDPGEVAAALAAIEEGVAAGRFAAGFLAYELGYALEPRLRPLLPPRRRLPLLRFQLFAGAERLAPEGVRAWLADRAAGGYEAGPLRPQWDATRYGRAFDRVREGIAAGDVYQINLTFPLRFTFRGNAVAFYRELRRRQHVGHGAFVRTGGLTLLSLSPELFLKIEGGRLTVRPMKGTAGRGRSPAEDADLAMALAQDEKSRAENLMIVDLVRNDLSRLAAPGGVRVTDLFTVETFRSLHQLTSGVSAEVGPRPPLAALLPALFPCGSVTGAPKIRAMEIIRELEAGPRGLYTGAIGMLTPDGRGFFNVAIRTLLIDAAGEAEMGVGSGVVFDSDAEREYAECLMKARFVSERDPPFALIETLKWQRRQGYVLLDRHLDRLTASAAYFAIPCCRDVARARLAAAAETFTDDGCRVRLRLDEEGEIAIEGEPLKPLPSVLHYALSPRPMPSTEPFRYHKTTRREAYEAERARLAARTGCHEVLFVNERGELTEGSWTNLFVQRGGRLLTPPVASGLLDGTLRRELLATRPGEVKEALLYPADLARADAVFLGNSVRGLMPARPVTGSTTADLPTPG